MSRPEHSIIELLHDIPEERLKAGDSGTIVAVYDSENYEVEFIRGEFDCTVITLNEKDIKQ